MADIDSWETTVADRYDRHRIISWWDQEILEQARILVVGAGALGNEVLKNLALLGIGHITICDFDLVDQTNLSRTVLFREADVGKAKALVAARAVNDLNESTSVEAVVGDVEFALGLGRLAEFNLVIGCVDSINARYVLNRMCQRAGVPWINGGINPVAAEVALFIPGSGGCYGCSMTEAMWDNYRSRHSCQQILRALPPAALPTTIPLASLAAAIQTQEAVAQLHQLSGKGTLNAGQKLFLSLMPYHFFLVDTPRSPTCDHHQQLQVDHRVIIDPEVASFADLSSLLDDNLGHQQWRTELPYDLLDELVCRSCALRETIGLPSRTVSTSEIVCRECGGAREVMLTTGVDRHSELATFPLQRLGIPSRVGSLNSVAVSL